MATKPYTDRDFLYDLYVEKKMSISEIAMQFGITAPAISYWMKKLEIGRRNLIVAASVKDNSNVDHSNKPKKINQYLKTGEYLRTFDSIADAGRATGIRASGISSNCHKKTPSYGGYVWRFEKEV